MDVLSYINSDSIKSHLEEIGYSFNSLETAWLIYSCNRLSYEDKKKAWLQLIAEMPDCSIPERINCMGWESLHGFLKQYISVIDSEIEGFYQEEAAGSCVYMYSYLYKGDQEWIEKYETVYPSLERCLDAFSKEASELDKIYYHNSSGVVKYRLKKQSLLDTNIVCEIECRGDGEVIKILRNTVRDREAEDIIAMSFDGMWFDFPTPFHKGDIVWIPVDESGRKSCKGGGFVLLGLSIWEASENTRKYGDNTDMSVHGYFVNDNGTIFHEAMCNYMELEYYSGPYQSNEEILPILSSFITPYLTDNRAVSEKDGKDDDNRRSY